MGVFSFIVCLLILLLVIIVIGSIQQFTIFCTTKKWHEFVVMIIPALLSFICFVAVAIGTYFVLKLFNIDALDIVYSISMKWDYSFNSYITCMLAYLVTTILFIVLQSFILKLIYIDYKKIYNFIKVKVFKKDEVKALNSQGYSENCVSVTLTNIPEKRNLPFFYALASSLFTFAICFFSILLFISVGALIANQYVL